MVDGLTLAPSRIQLKNPSLLTVSRIGKYDLHKGHAAVIDAMALVHQKRKDVHYYIVGTGELTAELKAHVQRLELSDNIHFLGFVEDDQLPYVYQQSDVYIMPSTCEGFGFVFAEAMAHGKSCIAGNVDASPEVVRHNETGLIVEPRNVEQLTDAILKLIEDEPLRKQFGEKGKRVVAEDFSYELFQTQLLAHLQSVVVRTVPELVKVNR